MMRSSTAARRAIKIAGALIVFAALGLLGTARGSHSFCLLACTKDRAAALEPTREAHLAALREQMERIHGGKVDAATMKKIEAEIVDLHRGPRTGDGEAGVGTHGDAVRMSSHGQRLMLIAQYLTSGEVHAEPASWKPSNRIEMAQATPVVAPVANGPKDDTTKKSNTDKRFYVGQKNCETCHQQEATNWAHTIHAKIFNLHPRSGAEGQNCEACHGPGSDHIQNPADQTTIISFSSKSKTPVPQQNAQCLSCHKGGQRIFWHDSIHESNNLACSDCHNPMTNFGSRGLTARESINETCFQCHKVQHAEFLKRSHMPLPEGKITCVDCHNPHGSTTPPLLKADSVNELCYTCHADKRGPFLFEHAPVRENCLNCHSPHGSNFENLLTTPRPVLCQQCHSQAGHPAQLLTAGNLPRGAMPDPRLISTSCSTCHVNIHGSNDPSGPRFER